MNTISNKKKILILFLSGILGILLIVGGYYILAEKLNDNVTKENENKYEKLFEWTYNEKYMVVIQNNEIKILKENETVHKSLGTVDNSLELYGHGGKSDYSALFIDFTPKNDKGNNCTKYVYNFTTDKITKYDNEACLQGVPEEKKYEKLFEWTTDNKEYVIVLENNEIKILKGDTIHKSLGEIDSTYILNGYGSSADLNKIWLDFTNDNSKTCLKYAYSFTTDKYVSEKIDNCLPGDSELFNKI